jgi:hypothetical protein
MSIVQNDLKVKSGKFDINMVAVENAGGQCGEQGTIKFTPQPRAARSNKLRLLQIVKTTTGGPSAPDYTWGGGESRRNQAMTRADAGKGVEGGYFVDHQAASATPRSKATDANVSPYYRDYWANSSQSQDGWIKSDTDIQPCSLWDFPSDSADGSFLFETAAKGEDNGLVYGTIKWQFTIQSSKIINESYSVHDGQSATFDAAVNQFNETYRNPGASTAPAASGGSGGSGGGSWI